MKIVNLLLIGALFLGFTTTVLGQRVSKKDKGVFNKKSDVTNSSSKSMLLGDSYTFAQTTATYSELIGATSINNGQVWDDPEFVIPVDFNFEIFNEQTDSLYFAWGLGGELSTIVDANFDADFIIAPFMVDLIDRGDLSGVSSSPISYKLEGSVGSRVLKVEWKNAGFYAEEDSLGTLNDFMNFQIWIYEASNDIEFHYGSSSIANIGISFEGQTGPLVGLTDDNLIDAYLLYGSAASPTLVDSATTLTSVPVSGTVYRFIKKTTGISSAQKPSIKAQTIPNPMQQSSLLKLTNYAPKNAQLLITDAQGREVKVISNIQTTEITIERTNLGSGVYFYQLIDDNKAVVRGKFIIE